MTIDDQELRARQRWLIRLRWAGIVTVLVTTHLMREFALLTFSMLPAYGILGFAALYNFAIGRRLELPGENLLRLAVLQILLDQIALALAVYFSGGCDSPFIYFFIFHVAISAITLPGNAAFGVAGLGVFFPALVMGLTHLGLLPHIGIFRNEPVIFADRTVIAAYGLAYISTLFLTAYFVTYLAKRLHAKNMEVRRLYVLSERLRSTIRLQEVLEIIKRELCGFVGTRQGTFLSLDKKKRALIYRNADRHVELPLIDKNTFAEALLGKTVMVLDRKVLGSSLEHEVLLDMQADRCLVLPLTAAAISPCYEYFQCSDKTCGAYGAAAGNCWRLSTTHCRGGLLRNLSEKLERCTNCELFTPLGVYVLTIPKEYIPLTNIDMDACMRLLDASGLAVSNALLYERTMDLSKTDGLTGLRNHREFKESLDQELSRAKQYRRPFTLLLIDVDHFKQYNDTHGHPQGDVLLRQLAELIRDNFKDTDIVARYGGEEFAVILLESPPREQGFQIAERLRGMVEWYRFPKEETQPGGKITISVGVSGYPDDGLTSAEILGAADEALYEAKRQGRNRSVAAGMPGAAAAIGQSA